ncbi:zinc finger and SCAN domain-containing protein 20-like isoform X2 [Sphaerodactylus townsendi]|uniref:zinc finger and SCAN domain-containing protein 20-like isoform X2 n=1 Tax=Sphaerodactylus townsendi TaxID=933632 RepID=UPI0020264B9E|nr:zinc finger and SCAN domain-containing protein 20-like isoform X2 [Sphaerodactylus townsendi]
MKKQNSAGLEREEGPRGAGEAIQIIQEPSPWEDAKAFLASFEQVAKACQWPREEWAARLLPALSGDAQQSLGNMEARDREDYRKVKAAILHWEANRTETLRQHFRQFRSREVEDPRQIYSQLQELCCQWLRPERHSKEQILELLILEQFLAILPPELRSWIKASSPENGTQAAALVDVFVMNHQSGAKNWKWQDSLSADEESLDSVQRKVYKEDTQNSKGEIHLLCRETKHSGHFSLPLSPEGQGKGEAGPEKQMTFGDTGVVKPSQTEPGPKTMFWQVLQEDSENLNTLEGFLVPKSGLASHMEKEEEMLVQFLEDKERLPGQDPGDVKRIKEEYSEEDEPGPNETWESSTEATQVDIPGTSEVHKQRCESQGLQVKKEYTECSEGLSATSSKTYRVEAEGGKPLFSKCERKYKLGPFQMYVGECPVLETNLQQKCVLEQHAVPLIGKKQCTLYECVKEDNLAGHQSQGEAADRWPNCGESIHSRKSFESHQGVHTKRSLCECPEGKKSFRYRQNLLNHQKRHTGEKLHRCPKCGKIFLDKEELTRHKITHAEERPFECPQCGKCFKKKDHLTRHKMTHRWKEGN